MPHTQPSSSDLLTRSRFSSLSKFGPSGVHCTVVPCMFHDILYLFLNFELGQNCLRSLPSVRSGSVLIIDQWFDPTPGTSPLGVNLAMPPRLSVSVPSSLVTETTCPIVVSGSFGGL